MRSSKRAALALLLAGASLLAANTASAWNNHALCTAPALAAMPELSKLAPVKAQSLASFLAADPAGLAKLLRDEEAWARAHVPSYPARPDALAFDVSGAPSAEALVARFLASVRVNPNVRLPLYLQLLPGQAAGDRPALSTAELTLLTSDEAIKHNRFVTLRAGEMVHPAEVLTSASDEPDYGLDIGLWSDNGTPFGARYGFGAQPFGNPAVEWSSQAPFHMGFFHEASLSYQAAPFLRRSHVESRIHLWRSLAAFAKSQGHDYWAWRFAGWGLHYLQDLTQPYHAQVLPGVGLTRMMGINALDLIGIHGPKDRMVQLVTNRHSVLEDFVRQWLLAEGASASDIGPQALRRTTSIEAKAGPYQDDWPRHVTSAQAAAAAAAIDEALVASLPAKYTTDPAYLYGQTESGIDVYAELGKASPAQRDALKKAVRPLLERLGASTRSYVRSLFPS